MSKSVAQAELFDLLKRPIVTEKTTNLGTMGQYVFEVKCEANKIQLAQAFEQAFPGRKVNAVRLITIPARTKRYNKKVGKVAARRKAVFSVTGAPIELFAEV